MITRFAPSPTGPLHLGHAYSAMLAFDLANRQIGTFLLRMEDIDRSRARVEWENQIYEDLKWLGLGWPSPVLRQSERTEAYREALDALGRQGLLYRCSCTRADIAAAVAAPQEGAALHGPDGVIYPGTCRPAEPDFVTSGETDAALRLDISRAIRTLGTDRITFTETGSGQAVQHSIDPQEVIGSVGDLVLARRGMGTSYHLSVVVDDAAQSVTHVVRGQDLAEATPIHVVLQRLLGLPTPIYHHHRLIRDADGKRLAKRDDARAIRLYRSEGKTADDIRRMVGLTP